MDSIFASIVNKYPTSIQVVAQQLRRIIKTEIPDAHESIYHGVLFYSLSESLFDRIVYLAMEKNYVRLGFNFGDYLPDPGHLLMGEGKRMRHVKIYTTQDAEQPAIRLLVKAAWNNGPEHVAALRTKRMKSRKTSS